ncbi:hypothetical protein KUTeg_012045 [Tegillarca granosa]|uniref:Shieldin complex subunit 2 first OB fold domain-containing protein n=1 Tax=Tegillarca granosa TaxID=220873 RepID=A0ABQ9F1Y7_TEGGR|nr:hypothetical protein KUTeg_012045 [Tegillarca granosa]
MQSASLEEICRERGEAPYNKKSLKVQVITTDSIRSYKNDQGQEKKSMNVAIGDSSMALKCIVYDETKFSKFKQGATLILKNIIKKTDAIAVTSASKIFPTVKIEVPDHVEEATQEVKVHNDSVKVKTIYVKDETVPRCKVFLWRELSEADVRPGDHISITDVVLNVFRGESSLSTTSLTKLQTCEAPELIRNVTVIGCSVEDLEVMFLVLSDVSDITVPFDIVKETFETDVNQACRNVMENATRTLMSILMPFNGDQLSLNFQHSVNLLHSQKSPMIDKITFKAFCSIDSSTSTFTAAFVQGSKLQ